MPDISPECELNSSGCAMAPHATCLPKAKTCRLAEDNNVLSSIDIYFIEITVLSGSTYRVQCKEYNIGDAMKEYRDTQNLSVVLATKFLLQPGSQPGKFVVLDRWTR